MKTCSSITREFITGIGCPGTFKEPAFQILLFPTPSSTSYKENEDDEDDDDEDFENDDFFTDDDDDDDLI